MVAQEKSQGPLPYWRLITKLCIRVGVFTEGKETFSALKPIDNVALYKYRMEYGVLCASTSQAPAPSLMEAGPSNSAPPAPELRRSPYVEQLLWDRGTQMHAMEQWMDRHFQYSVEAM